MRPLSWHPPVELSCVEQTIIQRIMSGPTNVGTSRVPAEQLWSQWEGGRGCVQFSAIAGVVWSKNTCMLASFRESGHLSRLQHRRALSRKTPS